VIAGLKKARQIGMKTIAFTGKGGGKCAELADILLDVPSTSTPRVQEVHVVIYHILCELVERAVAGS
jgi:D-sedoheptulose 7-phosphate isomerase